jgi:hemolysin activation/secretion protein
LATAPSSLFYSTPDFDEQQTIQVEHDFRLGSEGLALGGQFTYSWARPDLGDPAIDIESRTLFATVEASYPFLRRQAQTLRGSLGFDYIDQTSISATFRSIAIASASRSPA